MSSTNQTDDQTRAAARTAASRRLREMYPDEWNRLLGEEMGSRGIEWEPRLNKEQKAIAEIKRLLDENPEIDAEDIFG